MTRNSPKKASTANPNPSRSSSSMKRKRTSSDSPHKAIDTSKPTAIFAPSSAGGRSSTLSVALPASIILNAQTEEQKTALAGTLARALAVFCVNEAVIYDDVHGSSVGLLAPANDEKQGGEHPYTGVRDPADFLIHLLVYLETPPHLRRALFRLSRNLRLAGALPSLDMPHHLRRGEEALFREGVALARARGQAEDGTTLVECGLDAPVQVNAAIVPGSRVTLLFDTSSASSSSGRSEAEPVHPDAPRAEYGLYWGYRVRRAAGLAEVIEACPFAGGYDGVVGTSERGAPVGTVRGRKHEHLLVLYGGLSGLEGVVAGDARLREVGVSRVEQLCDYWVDLVRGQGSRTIRTEEALWLGLMGLRGVFGGEGNGV
ncbi:MAG: hypothetical protein M1829_006442 [Trizodia sp. TS-e1964]|nr:MAG: hypothetical protein M1829_006442 [Trizodia sp. TS-e1964]